MESNVDEKRLTWLSFVLDEGLRIGLVLPSHILMHATPEVLAEHLPRDLMVKVFASAFSTGKLTPEGILAVAPPSTLARHVQPSVLWGCVRDSGARQHLDGSAELPKGVTPVRTWLGNALAFGLAEGILTAGDVFRELPPREWVRDVPVDLVARLIVAGLGRASFDPQLALDVLTPNGLAEHVAPPLLWKVLDEAAARAFSLEGGAVRDVGGGPRTMGPTAN